MITFKSLYVGSSYLVYLQEIQVKFVYEGHWVKVTGAKNVRNAYSRSVNFDRP